MTARDAANAGEWQDAEATWDDGGYYADEAAAPVAAPRQGALQRIWTGRPMIYILAAGLIIVTALVLLTRPDAAPVAVPAAPATTNAPPLITYDAGPVIENELNKP